MKYQLTALLRFTLLGIFLCSSLHLSAQCDKKLKEFIEYDIDDIPVNVKPFTKCVDTLAAEINAQGTTSKAKPGKGEKDMALSKSDTLTSKEGKKVTKPAAKKLTAAQLKSKKQLLYDSYEQLINYYESSGVTDATKAKKYKKLKDNLKI